MACAGVLQARNSRRRLPACPKVRATIHLPIMCVALMSSLKSIEILCCPLFRCSMYSFYRKLLRITNANGMRLKYGSTTDRFHANLQKERRAALACTGFSLRKTRSPCYLKLSFESSRWLAAAGFDIRHGSHRALQTQTHTHRPPSVNRHLTPRSSPLASETETFAQMSETRPRPSLPETRPWACLEMVSRPSRPINYWQSACSFKR